MGVSFSRESGRRWRGEAATDEGYAEPQDLIVTPRTSHEQRAFARRLRREMSNAEAMLWRSLRARGIGAKFRRQLPIRPHVADFACVAAKLIVELDGEPHDMIERQAKDQTRDAWLAQQGWRVLRFANSQVLGGGDLVVDEIKTRLA